MAGDRLIRSGSARRRARPAWRVAFALALGAVAWTSLLPPDDLPPGLGLSDKVLHLAGYAVLGALAVLSGLRWPVAVAALVGFGLVIELLQGAVGYRSLEWLDLVADGAGALTGALLVTGAARWGAGHRTGSSHAEPSAGGRGP